MPLFFSFQNDCLPKRAKKNTRAHIQKALLLGVNFLRALLCPWRVYSGRSALFYVRFSFCIQLFSTEHRFNQSEKGSNISRRQNHVLPCFWIINHLAIPNTYAHTSDREGHTHVSTVKTLPKQWQNIYIKFNWISQTIQELPILKIAWQKKHTHTHFVRLFASTTHWRASVFFFFALGTLNTLPLFCGPTHRWTKKWAT